MIGQRSIRMGLAGLVRACGARACTPSYETLEVDRIHGSIDAEVSADGFVVPEGTLVVFKADAVSSSARDYEVTEKLELSSVDPTVARAVQGLSVGTWMIMGVTEGSTTIEVRIDGVLEDAIPVDVSVQEVLQ
jgi:hypothetical protein